MGAARSLDHWLSLLETRHPSVIELGLDRIASVLQRMALPRLATHIITVAGTNGKGSTVACINALLVAQGMRTGVYTSPHLVRFNERIVIDGQPVDDDTLCAAFERIESVRGGISLTYFEFTTLAAFAVFADAALDAVVLEVGLGGRLDAVNAVDADIAVVTRIALDHQDWLGDSLEQIAAEKAGVMRAGKPAVIGQPAPPQSLREAAVALGAPWYGRGEQFDLVATAQGWEWQAGATRLSLPTVQVP
ncbi:MAG: bifunctional tetrahydrofolate synthase/dihydrofolate synthase, partial [Gammaproteobacteria bacterium]